LTLSNLEKKPVIMKKQDKNKPEKSKVHPIHLYKIQKSLEKDGFSVEVNPDKDVPLTMKPTKEK
jgi:hypothetical protein